MAVFEFKYDPPLIVYSNGIEVLQISLELFKAIAWRNLKVLQLMGNMKNGKLFSSSPVKLRRSLVFFCLLAFNQVSC